MARAGGIEDGLSKLYTDIAGLQLLPDSAPYAQFLAQLQMAIKQQMQKQQQQAMQAAQQAAQGLAQGGQGGQQLMGQGAPGGQPLGPPPGPAQFGPGGARGGGSPGLVNMPNPDELRRVLAGSSGSLA